jgi:hypothetical protein
MPKFEIEDTFKEQVSNEELARTKSHIFTIEDRGDDYISVFPEPLGDGFADIWSTEFDAVAWIVFVQDNHVNGNNWALEKPLEFAQILWSELADVPINDDEEIDQDYLHFNSGTPCVDIWHWFENRFNLSIGKDLNG